MAPVPPDMIRGVRISCDWDVATLKAEKYIACEDEVFYDFMIEVDPLSNTPMPSFPISPLSKIVGLPFHVRKIPPNPSLPDNDVTYLKDKGVANRYTNQDATLLLVSMDPESEYRGFAPSFWQSEVGNVLVTRVDGKAIKPKQVEALCAYNFYLVNGPMQEASEQDDEGEEQVLAYNKVVDKVTPAKFREYFEYYTSIKEKEDYSWAFDTNPVVMTSSVTAWENVKPEW